MSLQGLIYISYVILHNRTCIKWYHSRTPPARGGMAQIYCLSACSEYHFDLSWKVILHRETLITGFTAKDIRPHIFLLLKYNIFWFKIKHEVKESKAQFQVETLQKRLYSGWVKTYYYNKWPNSLLLLCCALLSTLLPSLLLTGQNQIKMDYIPALQITLQTGGTCHGQLSFRVQEWHWQGKQIQWQYLHLCFCRLQQTDPCHLLPEGYVQQTIY